MIHPVKTRVDLCGMSILALVSQLRSSLSLSTFTTRTFSRQSLRVTPNLKPVHNKIRKPRACFSTCWASEIDDATSRKSRQHVVDEIQCVEVSLALPVVGKVTVLEATAASQETLVDIALSMEEDGNESEMNGLCLSMGDPYGAVLWPAASAVAIHLLQTCNDTFAHNNITVLEIGTGTGLLSLACALGGAKHVIATDYEPVPLNLLSYAAQNLNPHIDPSVLEPQLFDLCDLQIALPSAHLVVAADVLYEPRTGRAMARRAKEALERGSRFVLGDSPGRPGRPSFIQELQRILPHRAHDVKFFDSVGYTCDGDRHELICGKNSQSISPIKGKSQRLDIAIIDLMP